MFAICCSKQIIEVFLIQLQYSSILICRERRGVLVRDETEERENE